MPLCMPQLLLATFLGPATRSSLILSTHGSARRLKYTSRHGHGESERKLSPSRRSVKRLQSSPSKAIVAALEEFEQHHALLPSPPKGKVDISYCNIRKITDSYWNENDKKRFSLERQRQKMQSGRRATPARLSLHTIVAKATRGRVTALTPGINHANDSDSLFTAQELALLAFKKYTLQDVDEWATILTDTNATRAAKSLLEHDPSVTRFQPGSEKKPIPVFVFLFFLRRPLRDLSAEALSFALMHGWRELQRKRIIRMHADGAHADELQLKSYWPEYPTMDNASVMTMIVRLLRLARGVWPESLIAVSQMFTENFHLPDAGQQPQQSMSLKKKRNVSLARLAMLYNRVLSLVALPSAVSPFLFMPYHQRAQFDILRKMAEHKPPLTIGREGYRAVISVHLASKKTKREHEWDQLKARSWPPWKEDRTGLDEEKGPEYGVSTALQAIRHLTSAGYGIGTWERVAHILSGWDIDKSPTIQTRSILLQRYESRQTLLQQYEVMSRGPDTNPDTWAARIRATRTLQEAWACFLIYNDLQLKPESPESIALPVYQAMMGKLAATEVVPDDTASGDTFPRRMLNAGDGQEVFPTPKSPKEATYVRREPPTLEGLANELFVMGQQPDNRMLVLLISAAKSAHKGLSYLRWAAKHNAGIASLSEPGSEAYQDLKKVPHAVFTAVIKVCCRFSRAKIAFHNFEPSRIEFWQDGGTMLAFAQRLLQAYKPTQHSPYILVLRRLAIDGRQGLTKHSPGSDEARLDAAKFAIERYSVMREILESMRSVNLSTTAESFKFECYGLESAISAALQVAEAPFTQASLESDNNLSDAQSEAKVQSYSPHIISTANEILYSSGPKVRSRFYELMNGSTEYQSQFAANSLQSGRHLSLPRLLTTPYPSGLHNYIRVLGVLGDHDGLLELAEWMFMFRSEIGAAASESRGGEKILRSCLVALRMFVEGPWIDGATDDDNDDRRTIEFSKRMKQLSALAAPIEPRHTMEDLIGRLSEEWGGWPSDDEVERYIKIGKASRSGPPWDSSHSAVHE